MSNGTERILLLATQNLKQRWTFRTWRIRNSKLLAVSRMFFPHVPPAINYALLLGITCLTVFCNFTNSSSEFSGYLSKVLRNYTEQAGDGDFLSVRCPPRTTITVQSAFYGRSGPLQPQQGPSHHRPTLLGTLPLEDDLHCYMSTALQKMLDECQDRRSCKVLVNSRLFGMDPCPSSSKHLIVWYKCRPNEYKSKVACEEERMKLTCKQGMQITVYSAMFGRTQQGTLECPTHHRRASSVDCQSGVALQVLTTRCQGKQSCFVQASTQEFGDPCYLGTRKYLSVIYACDDSLMFMEWCLSARLCFLSRRKRERGFLPVYLATTPPG